MEIIILAVIAAGIWAWWKNQHPPSYKTPTPTKFQFTITTSSDDDEHDATLEEEKDNWEGFNYYLSYAHPATGRYRIKYVDQRGLATERDIVVKQVYEHQGQYAIKAHCLLRNANRSFLNDRINSAINLDSGEIIDSVARDAMAQFATSDEGLAYEQERIAMVEIQKEWTGISILMFVAKADGRLLKNERTIIAEYLKSCSPDCIINDSALDKMIKQLGAPDQREFKNLVKQLQQAGNPSKLSLLHDFATRIVDTGKDVDPFEKAAIHLLEKAAKTASEPA